MPSNFWTPSRIARLLILQAQGMSAARIAEVLGGDVSRSAVSSKLRRLQTTTGQPGKRPALRLVTRRGDEPPDPDRQLRDVARKTGRRAATAGKGGRRLRKKQVGAVPQKGRVQKLRVVKAPAAKRTRQADAERFAQYNVDAETLAEITPLTVLMIDDHCDIWFANQLAREMFPIKADGEAAASAVGDPDFRMGVEDAIKNRHVRDIWFPKQWTQGRRYQARICPLAKKGAAVFIREVGTVP